MQISAIKGGGLRNVVKCTFWYPKKTASRLKVMAAAETYSQTPAEDMCYLLEECKEAEMVSACPKSTFWTPKGVASEMC